MFSAGQYRQQKKVIDNFSESENIIFSKLKDVANTV